MTTATLTPPPSAPASTSIVTRPAPAIPGGNYPASQNADGTWNIYGVEIMGEFKKGEKGLPLPLGQEWQKAAIAKQQMMYHQGKHLNPLHIRHTTDSRGKIFAGYFLPTHTEIMDYLGGKMSFMFADYIAVPDEIFREKVLAGKLPFRSIESFDVNDPEIDELALLDDDRPHFAMRMMTVRIVEGTEAAALNKYDISAIRLAKKDCSDHVFLLRQRSGAEIFCFGRPDDAVLEAAMAPPAPAKKKKQPPVQPQQGGAPTTYDRGAAAEQAKQQGQPQPPPAGQEDPDAEEEGDEEAQEGDEQGAPQGQQPPGSPQMPGAPGQVQAGGPNEMVSLLRAIYAKVCAPEVKKSMNPAPAEQRPGASKEQVGLSLSKADETNKETIVTPTPSPNDPAAVLEAQKKQALELAKQTAKADAAADEADSLKAEKTIDEMVVKGLEALKGWPTSKRTAESLRIQAKLGQEYVDAYVADYQASRPRMMPKSEGGLTAGKVTDVPSAPIGAPGASMAPTDPLKKYGDVSPARLEAAKRISRQFDELSKFNVGMTREEFIDIALAKEDAAAKK